MFTTSKLSKILTSAVPVVASSVLRNAGRTFTKSAARCSSALTTRSRWRYSSSKVFLSNPSILCSKTCACEMHHKLTEGDQDLVSFLDQEISYEKESIRELPKIKDFKMSFDGGSVRLTRKHNGEKIVISFDVNENVNLEEANEEDDMGEEGSISEMVSYPTFQVQIIKDSGKTLQMTCMFNTTAGVIPEEGGDEEEGVIRFDSVAVLPSPDAMEEGESIYEAETENMDSNLYSLLNNTLYERGVNNEFAESLLEISTAVEHKLYVDFLQDLKTFFGAK
eukprot:gene14150-15627_t